MSWSFYLSHSGPNSGMKVAHSAFFSTIFLSLVYGVVGQNDFDFSFSVVA
jgi:hypothetical protein